VTSTSALHRNQQQYPPATLRVCAASPTLSTPSSHSLFEGGARRESPSSAGSSAATSKVHTMTNSIWRRTSLLPLLFLYYKRNASFHFCNLSAAALASSRTRHNREAPAPGCRDGSVAQTHPPPATSPVWPAAAVCRVWCIRLGTQACCEHGSSVHNHPLRSECPGFGDKCSRIQGRSRCNCAPNSQPGQPPGSTIEAIILVPCHPSASPSVHIVALAMRPNHSQSGPLHARMGALSL
jgi:hypothetical protein